LALSARLDDRLRGVIAATVTPFQGDDLAVDYDGIRANATTLASRGVDVFVVNGSIGEASSLSASERNQAVAATRAAIPDNAILIAGCSDADPAEVVRLARDAVDAGAQAILVQPPYHFRLRQAECVDFFAWLDREVDCPFILYDNPSTGRTDLAIEAIDQVARLRHFLALKEASADMVRFAELMDRFGSRFPIVAASEDPLLSMLVAGAPACMTASAAFAPEILIELVGAVGSSDLPRARSTFSRVQAFRRLFIARTRAGEPAYLPYTKAAVELVGGHAGPPRRPLSPITQAERTALARVLVEEMGQSIALDTSSISKPLGNRK
jgi:dihydrodipicolinate synthase/N-acetylneuraminate lyase